MEVSHFELVWKPQSPATPIGQTGVDRVFQGYFLKISNLEDGPTALPCPVSQPLQRLRNAALPATPWSSSARRAATTGSPR
jgi:hypothetical protein